MKPSIKHIALSAVTLLTATATLRAQSQSQDSTLNRTVVVENEYNPRITDADKINLLPPVEEPRAEKKAVEYARTLRPLAFFRYDAMPSYAPAPVQADSPASFIRLGYGNNGNVAAGLNYLFRPSDADRLNVNAAFDGFNFEPGGEYGEWKSRFYRLNAAADYAHRFRGAELGASASFGTQTFNYLPLYATDKQRNLTGGVQVGVRSTDDDRAWQYALRAGVDYFGRGYLYGADESNSETRLRLDGGLSYGADGVNRFGLDLSLMQANYSHEGLENCGLVTLTPFYRRTTDAMRLRLGVDVDIRTGYDSGLAVAPDVSLEFPLAGRYTLYVEAGGGTLVNDFFRFNALTPYWGGYAGHDQVENTHVQLDAVAGFKADLADNLWLDLHAGYELRKDELGFFPHTGGDAGLPYSFVQGKADNLKLGAASTYKYKDIVALSLAADYRSWSTDKGLEALLCDKPELDVRFDVDVRPLSRLTLNLGYRYRSYAEGDRDAVSDLYAGADYRLLRFFSLWAKASNLLGADYEWELGYPAPGTSFLVGASFRF